MPLNQGSKLTEINLLFSRAEDTLKELHTEGLASDEKSIFKDEFVATLEEIINVCKLF